MRHLSLLCLGALILAASASAANPVKATLTGSSTEPLVGEPWRYTITVRDRAGTPLAAKARLQILRGSVVVGCWKRTRMVRCSGVRAGTWIRFKGTRRATIVWPVLPVSGKLAFRVIVVVGTRTLRLRAPVTVQPRPSRRASS
jgi:hypothetical protein